MSAEPPPFQESARCDVCSCSFNAFRRRHHCRCCGRTLCHEHSSDQMALPQFGIYTSVRVCADCFNNSRSGNNDPQFITNGISTATDALSRVDINEDEAESSARQSNPVVNVPECKCGMPLCICETSAPDPDPAPIQTHSALALQSHSSIRQKRSDHISKRSSSVPNSKPSSFPSHGHLSTGSWNMSRTDYEVSGEGLKEAIKNSDTAAVQKLLSEGVDANYCDKQGLSLLHLTIETIDELAALFNQSEITFTLMDHGARLDCKNQQGETPLDCAPPMLQHKMRSKIEGDK